MWKRRTRTSRRRPIRRRYGRNRLVRGRRHRGGYVRRRIVRVRRGGRRYTHRNRRYRRSGWNSITTTKFLAFTATLDNSQIGTETYFYLTMPFNRSQQTDVGSGPLPDTRDSLINWVAQADYQRLIGYYQAGTPAVYHPGDYAHLQLNAARQVYRPRVSNVTSQSVAASITNQLPHSDDGISIQFYPRWEKDTFWDSATFGALTADQTTRRMRYATMDRRQNRAFHMSWRNRDPTTKWKIINPYYWTQGTENPEDPNDLVLPYTMQWYADYEATWLNWAQQTASQVVKTPGAYASAITPTNFKFGLSQPMIMVRMPPNTAAKLVIDVTRTLFWKGLTRAVIPQPWS